MEKLASTKTLGSYNISFEYNGKNIFSNEIIKDNNKAIPVIVKIEKYKYSGNYYMPLYKKIAMTYKCDFGTSNIAANNIFNGDNQFNGKLKEQLTLK